MNLIQKRLGALETTAKAFVGRRGCVWVRPGQSKEDALAEAGRPDDGGNVFFTWRAPQ